MKENFKKESPLLGLEGSGGGLSFFGGAGAEVLSFGSESVFESADARWITATYRSKHDNANNDRVVVAYQDSANNDYGTAVVGQRNGNSFTWGTPVVFNYDTTSSISATYDSSRDKVVICYADGNGYGRARVGTVYQGSNSIAFGTEATFENASVNHVTTTFDDNSNVVIVAYRDQENSVQGTACVGTVSGTGIGFGSPTIFSSDNTYYIKAAFNSDTNQVVLAYTSTSGYGYASVGSVNSTDINFGSRVTFQGNNTADLPSITFDSTNSKMVIAYKDNSNSNYGTAVVGTMQGTNSITFGSKTVFVSNGLNNIKALFDTAKGKVVIGYRDDGNSYYGTAIVGEVSGTGISFDDDSVVFNSDNSIYIGGTYITQNERVMFAYRDGGNSYYGTAVTGGIG